MKIKRIFIKIAAVFFRGAGKTFEFIFKKIGFIKGPLFYLGRLFFGGLIFPFYKLLYFIKYKSRSVFAPATSKAFYILNKNYFLHLSIVLIGVVVVVNSISAAELRQENFGERTVVYAIVAKESFEELTEETQVYAPSEQVLSYLDKTTAVESQRTIVQGEQPADSLAAELSTVTPGGAAVVKPNIIQPVKIEDIPTTQQSRGSQIVDYKVLPGETVSAIAGKFNVSVETILWQNDLGPRSVIRPGDSLEILPVSGVAHKVTRGQTVSAIAKQYDVDAEKIISFNNLFDASDIQIGQQLIVPGGEKTSPYLTTNYAYGSTPQVSPITQLFAPPAARVTASGMLWPTSVRRISQYYSWRHTGLDIAGPTGTPIYASEDGTVELSGWSTGYGNNIIINHGNGVKTRYGHFSKLYVSKGDSVVKGQTIGEMGSTGWSTGPHVHFEVIVGGGRKNPLSYVK